MFGYGKERGYIPLPLIRLVLGGLYGVYGLEFKAHFRCGVNYVKSYAEELLPNRKARDIHVKGCEVEAGAGSLSWDGWNHDATLGGMLLAKTFAVFKALSVGLIDITGSLRSLILGI